MFLRTLDNHTYYCSRNIAKEKYCWQVRIILDESIVLTFVRLRKINIISGFEVDGGVDLFKTKGRLINLKIKVLTYNGSNNWQDNLVPAIC